MKPERFIKGLLGKGRMDPEVYTIVKELQTKTITNPSRMPQDDDNIDGLGESTIRHRTIRECAEELITDTPEEAETMYDQNLEPIMRLDERFLLINGLPLEIDMEQNLDKLTKYFAEGRITKFSLKDRNRIIYMDLMQKLTRKMVQNFYDHKEINYDTEYLEADGTHRNMYRHVYPFAIDDRRKILGVLPKKVFGFIPNVSEEFCQLRMYSDIPKEGVKRQKDRRISKNEAEKSYKLYWDRIQRHNLTYAPRFFKLEVIDESHKDYAFWKCELNHGHIEGKEYDFISFEASKRNNTEHFSNTYFFELNGRLIWKLETVYD